MIGRYCDLNNIKEISDLSTGLDFRKPEYRREVFLRFYEYHTKHKGHAGAVYYSFPYIFNKMKLSTEEKLWFCFINGCSQNVISTYLIFKNFPDIKNLNTDLLNHWFRRNYKKIGWDTDRRYFKNSFVSDVIHYKSILNGNTQEQFFSEICNTDHPRLNFDKLWSVVLNDYSHFGRLSTFSYIEYLKIAGLNVDCSNLFLDDLKGSKSHRNGLCKVLGRDDLEWTKTNTPDYTKEIIDWLKVEAELLLNEAKERFGCENVNYFTLETTLCCYKGWHRVNRRYPNVYNDMFSDRIKHAESNWDNIDLSIFWDSRKHYLPKRLRIEDNPNDYGLCKTKQNHYRLTGEVIMMDGDYKCFKNNLGKQKQTTLDL